MTKTELKCGCGGETSCRRLKAGKITYSVMCKKCGVVTQDHNSEAEAIAVFRLATRADRSIVNSTVMCPDDGCCGCLGEPEIVGEPVCNECGKKYRIIPADVKSGINWISVKDGLPEIVAKDERTQEELSVIVLVCDMTPKGGSLHDIEKAIYNHTTKTWELKNSFPHFIVTHYAYLNLPDKT
ncbi:MAG: hypothetical protein WC356_03625 [Candidatus Micrarchaeia archaeon]|jgi:hypothetical protein